MIMRLLLLIALLLPAFAEAATVTFDDVATGVGTTSTSHSHTIAADANLIVIGVHLLDSGGAPSSVVGVTVGGQAATLVTGCARTQGNTRTELWAKVSPLTGSQTVAVDATGGTIDRIISGSMSFKNAKLTGTFGTCVVDGASDSTVNTINDLPTTVNDMGVLVTTAAGLRTFTTAATEPTSDERYDLETASAVSGAGYTEQGGASEVDLLVNLSASSTHADVGVVINAAEDASTTRRRVF